MPANARLAYLELEDVIFFSYLNSEEGDNQGRNVENIL